MTEEIPYEYTSSQLSKFFGITIKGIEFYEKKGLVCPKRVGLGNKRIFDLDNTYRLFMTRYLEQANFSLQECLNLITNSDLRQVSSDLKEHLLTLKKSRARMDAIINIFETKIELLEDKQDHPRIDICASPTFKRLFIRNLYLPHDNNQQQNIEYLKWNKLMPMTSASLKYTFDIDNIDKPSASIEIGMLIEEEYFYQFGIETSNRVSGIYYPKCLHSVILGDGDSIGKLDWAKPLFAYAHKHHLQPTGKLLTSLIFVNVDQVTGKAVRCDEVWLPLK